ncbi:MAG: type II toxin-antitoxin system HipA family toxin YjjJ [Gemmataceae bacterium]|nr:type II toxin-antitoxin system HipA family toxin YjjJ [Gemmataceae bacterium]
MSTHEQLVTVLRRQGLVSAGDLIKELGVSRATLSRLVSSAASTGVVRLGRGRATRYSLSRTLAGLGDSLSVYRIDGAGAVHNYATLYLLFGGRHWLERTDRRPPQGSNERVTRDTFVGLPPFAADMSPQGYIGRSFPGRFPELGLPPTIRQWSDDHRLIALARRGEDCVGNLIIGSESLARFLGSEPTNVDREAFAETVEASLQDRPGSSAGGEQPKFGVYSGGRHVLVKFARLDGSDVAVRWADLLVCERMALDTVRKAGIESAVAESFDVGGCRFLEVVRFDRVGARGRKGTISLAAIDAEYFGFLDNWTNAASRLLTAGWIDDATARNLRWIDTFGQLIGNEDRHFWNVSFFEECGSELTLTPVYDILPMVFAPSGPHLTNRAFSPPAPTAANLDVWPDAARWAMEYWSRLAETSQLSDAFRGLCASGREAVQSLSRRVLGRNQ